MSTVTDTHEPPSNPQLNIGEPRLTFNARTEGKRVYVASSFSNPHVGTVHFALEHGGFDTYDPRKEQFEWDSYSTETVRDVNSVLSKEKGPTEARDYNLSALRSCDLVVLVLPSGVNSHGDAMLALGMGKPVYVFSPNNYLDPHLLYGYLRKPIFNDLHTLIQELGEIHKGVHANPRGA